MSRLQSPPIMAPGNNSMMQCRKIGNRVTYKHFSHDFQKYFIVCMPALRRRRGLVVRALDL